MKKKIEENKLLVFFKFPFNFSCPIFHKFYKVNYVENS